MKKTLFIFLLVLMARWSFSQCTGGINSFPYTEGFETSTGGWTTGGTGNDWAWGTLAKPVINAAGGGTKCWTTGGLTGGSYTNSEASWLQSPCFDFSALQYPFVSFKINWETEQQFDGASFQYSIDNGNTWITIGPANYSDCMQKNWFNQDPVTYLSPLTTERRGWSGNKQPTSGSCRGGNGSNGWLTAQTIMPGLAFRPSVLFRFIFGAGSICNNYDGFAVDDIYIGEAPPNQASFTYICDDLGKVSFTNTSILCPTSFQWDFGDPLSGASNTSTQENPTHSFTAPGTYTITLTVNGPGNAPSTITGEVTIISVSTTMLSAADCQTNTGGSIMATVTGTNGAVNYTWNTNPPQNTKTASNLPAGIYTVTVSGTDICPAKANGEVITDFSCMGIFFPSGFTPNSDGKNDGFGPLGGLSSLRNYRLRIYNRWGQEVFSTTDPFKKWDGKVKDQPTDGNVFVWLAEFEIAGMPKETRKGVLALIR